MPEQIKKPTPTERLKETTAKLEAALVERDSLEKDILILNSELSAFKALNKRLEVINEGLEKDLTFYRTVEQETDQVFFTPVRLNKFLIFINHSELMEIGYLKDKLKEYIPEVYEGISIEPRKALKGIAKALNKYVKLRFGPDRVRVKYKKSHKQITITVMDTIPFLTISETAIVNTIRDVLYESKIGCCLITSK